MFRSSIAAATAACLFAAAAPAPAPSKSVIDFTSAEVGKPPSDVQIANGAFTVVERDGNKMLELAGERLDSFGLLFGPAQPAETTASARIQAESTGKRSPEFGIGVGDIGGYRLMLLPAEKKLELRKGDEPVASADLPDPWASGSWVELRLQVRKTPDGTWKVEGKSWPAGKPEPQAWPVSVEVKAAPPAGRASLWGIPFSGKPIRFDDLKVG
jgi:hypothetical protein